LNAYESKKKSYLFKKYSSFKQELKNETEEITLKKISKTYSDKIPALPEINEKTSEKIPEKNTNDTPKIVYGDYKPIPKKKGVHLICPKCGYSWFYTGKMTKTTTCPNCGNRVDIQKFKVAVEEEVEEEKKKDNIINYHGSESASFETLKKKRGEIKNENAR
jgi:predicted nucleic-acid-binding Zn-ribbon protein